MRNKIAIISKILQPFLRLFVGLLLLLPKPVCLAFFKCIRKVLNSEISEQLLEGAFASSLKARGLNIDVTTLGVPWYIEAKITLDVGDYIQRRFYLHGYPEFMPKLLAFCDDKTLFFDIGANVGLVSLGVATRVPEGSIHSFEPIPATFEQLERNVSTNRPGITCHRVALSNDNGELKFATIKTDSGSATVDAEYLQSRLDKNRIHTEMVFLSCPTQTFDAFWDSLSPVARTTAHKIALKIDVEGHEPAVLVGMQNFLRVARQEILIICETHYQNIQRVRELVESHGFTLKEPELQVLQDRNLFGSAQDLIFSRGCQ